ncbi:restriction endonuclease subunit S, partial [Enorma phocaeensis]|uniref:restriction endonuclease subunit S n=1 Tax=Enorma phocaeensis TaxID=1871019 RepID=UPI002354529D
MAKPTKVEHAADGCRRRVRLGDVCAVVSGSTPKTSVKEYWNGTIRWVTPAEIKDDTRWLSDTTKRITDKGFTSANLTMMPAGTVLLSSRAPIGKLAITTEPMCCNQGFKNLICSDEVINEYLFWHLKAEVQQLQSLGRGATFKELSKKAVENYRIWLPPINEQRMIASHFSTIDALTNKLIGISTLFESLIKSRFTEMFETAEIRRVRLADCCERITKGTTPTTIGFSYESTGVIFIKIETIDSRGELIPDKVSHISPTCHSAMGRSQLFEGDLLFSIAGAIGRCAIVPSWVLPANTNQALSIIRLKNDAPLNRFYLKEALSSSLIIEMTR